MHYFLLYTYSFATGVKAAVILIGFFYDKVLLLFDAVSMSFYVNLVL